MDFSSLLKPIFESVTSKFGISGIVILGLTWLTYQLVTKIIADKDAQIKLLADENKEYRERFTMLLDRHHKLSSEAEK